MSISTPAAVCVRWLDSAADQPDLGGKARALARLARAGLPVPPGFVLPAAPQADPGALPEEDAAALLEGYAELARRTADPEPLVAVRSSALAEDLAQASFAGQYLTVLGVRGAEALLDAAARCRRSLLAPEVAAYREAVAQRTGQPLPAPGMAVLVQLLVPAEAAGVAETGPEGVTISAAWGLGSSVVDGLVEPDTWRVAREPLAVTELRTGDKASRAAAAPGAPRADVPEALRRTPCLTTEQAAQVAALALRAEELTGGPADVEWAVAGERAWLLQARPLVGAAPDHAPAAEPPGPIGPSPAFPFAWPDQAAAQRHWQPDADDGRLFEALPPFEIDARLAFIRGMARAEWAAGAPDTSALLEVNGYLYSGRIPAPDEQKRAARAELYQRSMRALHALGETHFERAVLPEMRESTARHAAVDPGALDDHALAAHLETILAWYERAWSLHFSMDPWDDHSPTGRLASVYAELSGDENRWAVFTPFAHAPQTEHDGVAALIELAQIAKSTPALHALVATSAPAEVLPRLDTTPGGERFRARLDALLAAFGLHCGASQGVLGGQVLPSWGEDPSLVVAIVQRYLPQDLDALAETYRRAGEQYRRDVDALRARVAAGASAEDLARFDFWFDAARRMITAILNHNHHIDSPANALLHRALTACGRRLADAGAIDAPEDVWWLRAHQVAAAVRSLALSARPDWRGLVAAARALHGWQRTLVPPPYLGAPPPAPPQAHAPAPAADDAAPPNLLLRGQGAYPATATGRVRLVDHRALVPDIRPGDVFVAADCGVLWAVLLPVAAAVVLDGSNPHEHAMRVCRDFGVPGVVQTKAATRVLREGQVVTVDGARGWVLAGDEVTG